MNKLFSLSILPLLVCSCSKHGSHYLVKNIDSFFSESLLRVFDIDEVESMIKTNNEFMIYFSSTGCSSCDIVSQALEEYLPQNRILMYNLDYQNQKDLAELFVAKYPENFKLEFPSVYIVKQNEVTQISTSKLDSYNRISNTFKEYQHDCNLYFSNDNILEKMSANPSTVPFKRFAYVSFNFKNNILLQNYSNYISSYLEDLEFPTIVTSYTENSDSIFFAKLSIEDDGNIGCRNQTTTVDFSNIKYIKTVINS